MAEQEKSIFEELAPYSRMVVVPGVTVGNLVYSNQQDLYSTAVASSNASGVVAANTELFLFNAALNEQASNQGYSAGVMGLGQTNSKFSKGQAPANQVFVATHAAFVPSKISTTDLTASPAPIESLLDLVAEPIVGVQDNLSDLWSIAQNFSWDLTIGRGITRTIGPISEYVAPGVFGVAEDDDQLTVGTSTAATIPAQLGTPEACYKKLEVPIIFPPLVNVTISAKCGGPFQLIDPANAVNFQLRMVLRGFLMTMPVG